MGGGVRGHGPRQGHRGPQDQGPRGQARAYHRGQLQGPARGPEGARHRQPLRPGPDPDGGRRERPGPRDQVAGRPHDPRRDSDGRRHQSRQLRRPAAGFPGTAHRRQHGHLEPHGGERGYRLRRARRHGQGRRAHAHSVREVQAPEPGRRCDPRLVGAAARHRRRDPAHGAAGQRRREGGAAGNRPQRPRQGGDRRHYRGDRRATRQKPR